MAENLNLNINVGGNATESVGSLKAQLRSATAEVAILSEKFGATSIEAANAAKRAAELRDRIGDAQLLTQAFNPDAKFRSLTASLSGVAGGFSAVQGAIGLFGIESKEVEKQLLKVQSALALSQGLQSIGESVDAFKSLKTVIMVDVIPAIRALGTAAQVGIGLIIAGVSAAIYAWMDYIDTQEKVKKAQEENLKSLQIRQKAQLEGEMANIDREEKLELARVSNKKNNESEIYEIEQKNRRLRIAALERYYAEISNKDSEDAIRIKTQIDDLHTQIEVAEITFNNQQILREKEKNLQLKQERDKRAKEEFDAFMAHVQTLKTQTDSEIELQQFLLDEKKKKDDELFNWRVQQAQKYYDQTEAEIELQKYLYEKDKENKQAVEEAKYQIAKNYVDAVGFLFDRGTALGKAAALASIALDVANGYTRGLAIAQEGAKGTGPAAPFAFPLFYSTQVLAILTAAAKAKQVLSTVKGGGALSFPTPTGAPPLSPTLPQAQMTSLNQATINALGNQAIRAYVVETDMTTNQQRIQAIRQRARFG